MIQLELRLIARIDGPSVAPNYAVSALTSYREAVCACWMHRRVAGMTKASLAELTGMRPSHISDYLSLSEKDRRGAERREMPAKYITAFQQATGNCIVTQWLASQDRLTILESLIVGAA